MNLLERLRKNRFAPAVPEERRSRPVWNGFGRTGFKTLAASVKIPAPSPALPKQPSHMFARLGTPIERPDRGKLMAVAEEFNATTGELKQSGLAVFRVLLFRFLNHYTGQCNPAYDTIGRVAGVSRRTVARALARLRAAGLLHWLASFAAGKRSSNRYRIGTECQKGAESPPKKLNKMDGERKLRGSAIIEAMKQSALTTKVSLSLLGRYNIIQT